MVGMSTALGSLGSGTNEWCDLEQVTPAFISLVWKIEEAKPSSLSESPSPVPSFIFLG